MPGAPFLPSFGRNGSCSCLCRCSPGAPFKPSFGLNGAVAPVFVVARTQPQTGHRPVSAAHLHHRVLRTPRSDLSAPVAGTGTAINDELATSPEKVNSNPHTAWMVKVNIANPAEMDGLLSAEDYEKFIAEEKH